MKIKNFKKKIALFIMIMQIFHLVPSFEVLANEEKLALTFL